MFLKNFTAYRLSRDLIVRDLNDLNSALHIHRERPLGAMERAASGFVQPLPSYRSAYALIVGHCESKWMVDNGFDDQFVPDTGFNLRDFSSNKGDALVMMFYREEKVVVGTDIKRKLNAKIAEIESAEMRKVYKRERDELRELIIAGILPHAQSRYWTVPLVFFADGTLLVGATGARAEHALNELRAITGSLPIRPITPSMQIPVFLTRVAQSQQDGYPGRFLITSDFQMQDTDDDPSIARCKNTSISDENITEFMADGRVVTHALMLWDDRISFKIDPKFTLRGLRVDEGAYDDAAPESEEDATTYAYTTAMIELTLVIRMLGELIDLLDGEATYQGLDAKDTTPIYLEQLAQYARNTTPDPEQDDDDDEGQTP